jgi:hypothetical protein
METAFGFPVRDSHGASEFPGMAYDCGQGWLHLRAGCTCTQIGLVLEPVNAELHPVPPVNSPILCCSQTWQTGSSP